MRINTNILSLSAQRNLSVTTRALARAMEKLASGSRINSARDDAAGLAISGGLEAQRRGMLQAVRNMNDARGFLNTAEGAIFEQTSITQRLKELALQSANGTLSSADRTYLDNEFQSLLAEFDRIAKQTQFNGTNLLDGSFSGRNIQVGTRKGENIQTALSATSLALAFTESTTETTTGGTVGAGTFQVGVNYGSTGFEKISAGDLDGDGDLDVVGIDWPSNSRVFLNNGDGTFPASTGYAMGTGAAGNGPRDILLKDLNGDNNLDMITADYWQATVSVRLGVGDGTFSAQSTYTIGTSSIALTASDFDGDGEIDIGTIDRGDQTISILLGNGNGSFQNRTTVGNVGLGVYVSTLVAADINGDNEVDLVTTDSGTLPNTIILYLGNGNGTFQSRTTFPTIGNSPEAVIAVDLNEDGTLDLVSANTNAMLNIFMGNGNGTFLSAVTLDPKASGPHAVASGDLNGDGLIDLVSGNTYENTLSIFIGNGNGTFQTPTTISTGSNPQSPVIADMNGDGVSDIIATPSFGAPWTLFLQNTTTTTAASITTTAAVTMSIRLQSDAEDALAVLDTGLAYLNQIRANIGALQNRLDYAESNTRTMVENISAAKSQMMDTDFAHEMAEFTRLKILQQAGIAVLSQANLSTRMTLKLLETLA